MLKHRLDGRGWAGGWEVSQAATALADEKSPGLGVRRPYLEPGLYSKPCIIQCGTLWYFSRCWEHSTMADMDPVFLGVTLGS
jgi:hypothetical protein